MPPTILPNCAVRGDRGSRVMIPNRKNRKQPYPFDAVTYRRRNIVERTFCPSRISTPGNAL